MNGEEKELAKKGWKNVGLKERVISHVQEHLKVKDRGKAFPRSIPKFITEAIENQIEKERSEVVSLTKEK